MPSLFSQEFDLGLRLAKKLLSLARLVLLMGRREPLYALPAAIAGR